ncbi:hypothetical protein Tco_1301787 [Tanacetum coccineum]
MMSPGGSIMASREDINGFLSLWKLVLLVQLDAVIEELRKQSKSLVLLVIIVSAASTNGDYEMWRLRIEQYYQIQDYALWDIIKNGNSFNPVAQTTTNADGTSTSEIPGPVTTEEKVQKNKPDLESMSFDDLYNNFKIVEQEVKRTITSSSNSGSQNMAFVSTPGSTNEVNTANVQVSTANSTVSTDSTLDSTANLSDLVVLKLSRTSFGWPFDPLVHKGAQLKLSWMNISLLKAAV